MLRLALPGLGKLFYKTVSSPSTLFALQEAQQGVLKLCQDLNGECLHSAWKVYWQMIQIMHNAQRCGGNGRYLSVCSKGLRLEANVY